MHLGRQCPELPCGAVFEEAEWKAACTVAAAGKKRGPLCEPTLGSSSRWWRSLAAISVAGTTSPPGAQAIWQGLLRVRDFACAWQAIHPA